jgi:hypothetical protein
MNEGTVRQCAECSKMGKQIFMIKSEVVDRPSVVGDDLAQSVDLKISER